jgi:23S rRNA (guanosine2251-2'-O)-methyltransferase
MSNDKQFVFGVHAVSALLSYQPERVVTLYILKDRQDQKAQAVLELAKQHRIKVTTVTKVELERLTKNEVHQGMVAHCLKPKAFNENDLEQMLDTLAEPPFLLILDGVQDPHNLGACLRSADAAGVHAVIVPKDKSVALTATVSKVASGAAETVPFVQVTNLARTMEMLKERGIWLYGAAGETDQSLFKASLTGPVALILGAEGEGLRRLTKERCDMLLKIPMNGSVSSLNVSVATGIFLFEAVRQRQ